MSDAIANGRAVLGIELGSTRIKACLIGDDATDILATGTHEWQNSLVDGSWTYADEEIWSGLQAAYADLVADARARHGGAPQTLAGIGISAMMHGYLAFDARGELLVPFRTWRNTSTGEAAAELTALFGVNIPLRWSIAHLHQAVRDAEPHLDRLASLTTLAGYVHRRLTGENVLGVGDASGMFPIGAGTSDYDDELVGRYDALAGGAVPPLRNLLPRVLPAGAPAGRLTAEGAAWLDPTGTLQPGAAFCPPEGDAGTGMVATAAVAPGTGNVSVGTSVFAMVVLDRPLRRPHPELDIVTTPAGDAVAMVHCNNGASELAAWAGMFRRFAEAAGTPLDDDAVFDVLFREAVEGEPDAGGLLAYNHLSGEPVVDLAEGRPLFLRTPDSRFTLANAIRAQLYGVFASLALGMRALTGEGVRIDRMSAHGGVFRTAGVAQRFVAAALDAPVAVIDGAAEGGAWGAAVLAAYAATPDRPALGDYLRDTVFAGTVAQVADPDPDDVVGFATYLARYEAGLAVERTAATTL